MNSVVRQLYEQNTDIVMVDTGNSYEGLCEYLGGKYISYTNERPITMNPFKIGREELNVEKMEFLKNMILLIWKGAQGEATKQEARIINMVIGEYYDVHFNGFKGYSKETRREIISNIQADMRKKLDENEDETRHQQRICEIYEWKDRMNELPEDVLEAGRQGNVSGSPFFHQ